MPTASQNVVDTQDTLLSVLVVALPGATGDWIAHALPFHVSASARTGGAVTLTWEPPAASQNVADVQDTAFSVVNVAFAGLGGDSDAQVLPFHCSARVTTLPLLDEVAPTAWQEAGEEHDTPMRLPRPLGPLTCPLAGRVAEIPSGTEVSRQQQMWVLKRVVHPHWDDRALMCAVSAFCIFF